MAAFILGLLIGAGIVFLALAYREIETREKFRQMEKEEEWRRRLP